ncbi:WD repeat-containing protein 36 [Trichostrongylus colubriformis]|uniref:WD repeat-containing protein 36 n=1 Tax=Trichostrongylus colubriformis TaxID=6319 RepID=A0AAN8ET23_TRICO
MRRTDSTLFAPYRSMGVVCSHVRPVIRPNESKIRMTSLLCPVDNVIIHYKAEKLRLIGISDVLPDIITAITADRSGVFVACGTRVAVMKTCRHIDRYIEVGANTKFMSVLGDYLVIVDEENGIRVFNIPDGQNLLHMEGSRQFHVTAMVHPSTYLYKILIGSSIGTMRLINFRTGRIIHEFSRGFDAPITVLEQSPAVDVMAIGLANGQIILHNIRVDETICKFRHEKAISAVGFRKDDKPLMTTADVGGDIVVWNLEKRQLVGKVANVHHAAVTELYFMPGEPIMVSASADNSLRTWVLDGGDDLPRQLVILEGHGEEVTAVQFNGKQEILSSGMDGSVRKYMVNVDTMRQKLGSAGTMSRAVAKKKHIPIESIRMEPVIDMAIGWSREAAWDNVLCRHKDTLLVTTWTTRKNAQGTHKLVHERFVKDAGLSCASATAIALSPCGNFAFIGYSTGHVDQFNVQSGRFIKTFAKTAPSEEKMNKREKAKVEKAHSARITALTVNSRGSELITGCSKGSLKFWHVRSGHLVATMRTRLRIERSAPSTSNSLLAVACAGDEGASVAVVDTLCRRVVRTFNAVGGSVNALTFSSDGRWLLTADDKKYIRVWELSTAQLIDVMLFDKPCISMSFNSSGEYLATVHEGEKAIFIWVNKKMYASHVNIRALPLDYIPTWADSCIAEIGVNTFVIDDESDDESQITESILNPSLVTYSGLAPSRWANLPDLALIKERNKPDQPARKPKQAPFFLTAAPTLEGFEFEVPQDDEQETRRTLQAKRTLLELESSFSSSLRAAETGEELFDVFSSLKKMSVSAIDFQLRTLPVELLPKFFKMLTEVLRTRKDFELVQAYMATAIKIHRSSLWKKDDQSEGVDELMKALEELSVEEEHVWLDYDQVMVQNAAVAQWVKNALL